MRFIFIFFVFILPVPVYAELIITEVYPAPSQGSYEWIEVYNPGIEPVDTSPLYLEDESGKKIYFPDMTILPDTYSIATASNILNNSGDTILLKTTEGAVLDKVVYTMNISSSESYSRCSDSNNFSLATKITKGTSNALLCTSSPTPPPTPTKVTTITQTPPLVSPTIAVEQDIRIIISEIYPYPNQDEQEWVEVYNPVNTDIQLTNWYIDDIENGGASPVAFSATVPALGYATVLLPKHILNNGGDTVRLLNSHHFLIASARYEKSTRGLSIGKVEMLEDILCEMEATPGRANSTCREEQQDTESKIPMANPVVSSTDTDTKLLTPKNSSPKKVLPQKKTNTFPKLPEQAQDRERENISYSFSPGQDSRPYVLFLTGSIILSLTGIISIAHKLYKREFSTDWQISEIPLY